MNFTNDNSTQSSVNSVSYTQLFSSVTRPSILFNDLSSGIYNPSSNKIILYTSGTTALTIDSNQCIYGNGTGLSNIGYSNIINKPSTFPSDWNTTINKPTNFQSDWNSTVINKPTNFQADWNSTIINKPDLTGYATTINLNNLSTNSTLSINNLNSTSTSILNLVNGNTTSINNLNATSSTLLGYINSNNTSISFLNATSSTLLGLVNGHTTSISFLNATSTTLLGYINSNNTSISFLNLTSTTTFNNVNSLSTNSTLSINNLNSTSTSILNLVNGHTTSINNLNATSTTLLSNLNSLSGYSFLNISNLNTTSTTIFNKTAFGSLYVTGNTTLQNNATMASSLNVSGSTTLSNNTTINGTLNVTGIISGPGNGLTNLNYGSISNPPSLFPCNNFSSAFYNSGNVLKLNSGYGFGSQWYGGSTTNGLGPMNYNLTFSSGNVGIGITSSTQPNVLYVSGDSVLTNNVTMGTNLNVLGNIIGNGTAITNLNYNSISNPPAVPNLNAACTFISSLNVSGNTTFQGSSTHVSSLNVSGVTTLANATTCLSSLNVSGLTGLSINSQVIYNFLFNNTGGTHGDINDFNNITTAGYKFVQGYLNSPTPSNTSTQYYSWLIGLGTNYPVTGAGSYGCQFALLRGTPRLYMRYNEYNSWGSWGGVIAASADALTSGDKTISGNLTVAGLSNIHNGSPYAVPNNFMASGSLTIGGTTSNYGGTTNWTSNTAGLMMECLDNTEITIHDSGNRLASFMLYNGGATAQFNMGANKGWGTVKCNMVGGLKINNIDTPLTNANTQFLSGNPVTYTIYNKGYPFCLFYVTVASSFGIYLGTNITAGSSFAPSLIFNGNNITYYVPYFTNQVGNGTIMWIYNASGGVQVSCFEIWFN